MLVGELVETAQVSRRYPVNLCRKGTHVRMEHQQRDWNLTIEREVGRIPSVQIGSGNTAFVYHADSGCRRAPEGHAHLADMVEIAGGGDRNNSGRNLRPLELIVHEDTIRHPRQWTAERDTILVANSF